MDEVLKFKNIFIAAPEGTRSYQVKEMKKRVIFARIQELKDARSKLPDNSHWQLMDENHLTPEDQAELEWKAGYKEHCIQNAIRIHNHHAKFFEAEINRHMKEAVKDPDLVNMIMEQMEEKKDYIDVESSEADERRMLKDE